VAMSEIERYLEIRDLVKIFNVTQRTIMRWKKNPSFPKSFSVERKVFWRKGDIDAYVESLLKDKNKDNSA
jgi:predicted DNA-binding transcriptional regulator AlpA